MVESPEAGTMRSGRTLNHLVPGRDCGDCVACCEVLRIVDPEVGKPAGVMCRHNTGKGCGIHAIRPDICRTWFCLWRRIDAMPDEARPDRSGVIFCLEGEEEHPNPFARFCVVARPVAGSRALRSALVRQVVAMFARQGELPVWVHRHGVRSLIHPPPDLADAIERPQATPFQAFVPAALAWRRRHRAMWPQG
ncbi:hypothetical protein B6S44_05580 [Bosea sp. Tri-44]|uniref:YkgJ family cysteine cluster protein n=1 Tax=Bosea sp. Tri-44 TaxID=1972137 RepID=UPI00102581E6|nr:YkgJ family cysteine cluster protein [Bosea sp. Tri-44]RXT56536.1 hypothetical protein B6S44_05580 [Bosea sp. Tri-44]